MSNPKSAAETPRPSWPLVICSWLVIAGCVFLGSVGIAGPIARAWDPCAWFAALFFGFNSSLLGFAQYVGTFRSNRNASMACAILLLGAGGMAVLSLVVSSGEFIVKERTLPPLDFVLIFIAISAFTITAGCLNLLRSQRLRSQSMSPKLASPFQISLREFFILMAAVSGSLAVIMWVIRSEMPRVAEHVEMHDPPFLIPAGATDLCWEQGFRGTMTYEFTLDEARFRKWVEEEWLDTAPRSAPAQLEEATVASPARIYTYKDRPPLTDPDGSITITNGLVFSWSEEDRGVHTAWDRATQRVYFDRHSH